VDGSRKIVAAAHVYELMGEDRIHLGIVQPGVNVTGPEENRADEAEYPWLD
jgi:hypothetical protein